METSIQVCLPLWTKNKELQEKMYKLQVYVDETNLMKRRYEKQIKEIKKAHEEELGNKDEEIQAVVESTREEMMAEHKETLERIDQQIEDTRQETEQRIEAIEKEHATAVTKLKDEKQKLKEDLAEAVKRSSMNDALIRPLNTSQLNRVINFTSTHQPPTPIATCIAADQNPTQNMNGR
jgi:DNA repair exonuclease SbcCD ATPase subunit